MRVFAVGTPSLLDGAGSESHRIAHLWWSMLGLAVVVYVVVAGLVIVAVMRRRRADGPEAGPGDERFVWWGGIAVPLVILSALAGATVGTTLGVRKAEATELTVDVVGHDWWWQVTYAGTSLQSANEIHLPVGRTAVIRLTSDDVVHSFWVPQLAGKLDVVPGQTNVLRLKPNRTGTFLGECAEFCGVQHANMRFLVVVQDAAAYAAWTRRQPTLPPFESAIARGAAAFQHEACAGCHTITDTQAAGTIGPDLSDFGRRERLGAGVAPNTPDDLLRWLRDPDALKPGVLMPGFANLPDGELRDLVAYLESLR